MKKQLGRFAAILCSAALLSVAPVQYSQAAVTAEQAIGRGVDVSKYQGAIDWGSVAAQGYSFAFVKIGSSKGGIDPFFAQNMVNANAAGLRVGGYVYSYATTVEAAVAEANMAIQALANYPVSFPIAFDIEDNVHKGLDAATQQSIVAAFCNTISAAGYYPMVYASKSWFLTRLGQTPYDQWVAQYNTACDYPLPLTVWQASSTGTVAGIGGKVDIDYLYKDYSGVIIQNGWVVRNGFNTFYENWHMKTGWITWQDATYYSDAQGHMVTGWTDLEGNGSRRYFTEAGPMATGLTKVGEATYIFGGDGVMLVGWQNYGGLRYLLAEDGTMQFGWYHSPDGTFYLIPDSGAMATGWNTLGDKRYHFNEETGAMSASQFVQTGDQRFYVEADGAMVTGFHNVNGATYYFNGDGVMLAGLLTIDDKRYYFAGDGIMQTGWQLLEGAQYYFDPSTGAMVSGWLTDGNGRFFLGEDGIMRTGLQTIEGAQFYFAENGVMQTGWQTINGGLFYFDPTTGQMATGWVTDATGTHYLGANGAALTGWQTLPDGKTYHFDENTGALSANAVIATGGVTFFVGADGSRQVGWQNIGGGMFYFQADGSMAQNVVLPIDGVTYSFDANGIGTPVVAPVDPAAAALAAQAAATQAAQ